MSKVPDAKERELKEKEKSLTDASTTPHTIIGNVTYTCAKKSQEKEKPLKDASTSTTPNTIIGNVTYL